MMRRLLLWIACCGPALAGCEGASPLPPSNELVVVRGYLHADRPVSAIHVSSTIGLGSPDTLGPPVSDATVQLTRDDVCYEMVHRGNGNYGSPSNPYTPDCPDCGLVLSPGDVVRLDVLHFGKIASAVTVIPHKPDLLAASADTVYVSTGADTPGSGDAFELTWIAQGDHWFYVEVRNVSTPRTPVGGGDPVYGLAPSEVSEPFNDQRFVVTRDMLPWYGRYRVQVYTLNREYVELYLTRNQDSRDLNEPVSNVDNGLGIFTAVNSSTVDVTVLPANQ